MALSSLLFIFVIVVSVCSSPLEKNLKLNSAKTVKSVLQSDYKLPTTIVPRLYDLLIVPEFNTFTFQGETTIYVSVKNETSQIILNQKDLTIISVSVMINTLNVMYNFTKDDTLERLIIQNSIPLPASNNVIITIKYNGTLTDNMLGFYRSSYVEKNDTKWLAITQFESTYARQAFPCFDEPAYRANFTIRLGRDSDWISMSNYPLFNTSGQMSQYSNKVIDLYQTTAPMPTYLVAFCVSQFVNLTNGNFNIFMRPQVQAQGDYLLSKGQNILDTIAKFLNVSYALPKMDVVAVPDFDAGAMENWGLTTYREKYVLYDSKINSASDKQLLLNVVSHEFGHQWFGDLVTPEWWSYAWLNEAFATYFEYVTPSIMEPTWGTLDQYVFDNVQSSLADDVGSPRPMTAVVNTPTEIDNLFDYVIYEKGGSVLRMTEHFLTTPVWKAGLKTYLEANEFATGNPDSLFDHLENAENAVGILDKGIEVSQILKTWTTQPGYPLVTVDTSTANITLTQKPFALNATYENLTWYVPLSYTTEETQDFKTTTPSAWLIPGQGQPSINISRGWVIFNIQETGFYRVNYDANNWQKLTDQLTSNHSAIGSLNRAQLLDDSFKLARYGYLNYSVPLGLTTYLSNESDYVPWLSAASNLKYLTLYFSGTTVGNNLQEYARELLADIFTTLTSNRSDTEAHLTTLSRLKVVTWACDWKLSSCESYANNMFLQWYTNQNNFTIPPDVKQSVFCTGLRLNNDSAMFNAVWHYYLNSNNYADKLSVMYSLGCSESETFLLQYLNNLITNENVIRRQDKWIVFRAVVQRQTGISTAINFLADNYDKLISNIGEKRVGSMISSLAAYLVQEAHVNEFKAIIANSSVSADLRSSMNATVAGIETRQTWASANNDAISSWISSNTDIDSSANIISSVFILNFSLIVILSFYCKYFTLV